LGEKIFDGAVERPIVRRVIATGDEAVGFGGMMGGVKEILRCEKKRKAGIGESGMAVLWSFRKVWRGEPISDYWWEFFVEMVGLDNASDIGDGGWIGNCGTGREGGFLAVWDIGNGEREFGGA